MAAWSDRLSHAPIRRDAVDGGIIVAAEHADALDPDWFRRPARALGSGGGRGSVAVVDTVLGPLLRRNYLRGGLPRHLLRDRYLWAGAENTRALREFRLSRALFDAGLPVPEPIAARYWRGWLAYRAALLTRLLPDVRTLRERLAAGTSAEAELPPVADAIARLHDHGVWHADLNADNVLIDDQGKVWLIDFDRSRADVSDAGRLAGNLDRLLRSLRKHLPPRCLPAVQAAWPAFQARYRAARELATR